MQVYLAIVFTILSLTVTPTNALPEAYHASTQSPFVLTEFKPDAIPGAHTSAILARRLLRLSRLGTLSTVFSDHPPSWPPRPPHLAGIPIGLPDYVADCERQEEPLSLSSGNPTLLAFDIATNFRNAAAGSNVSLTLQWVKPTERTRPSLLQQELVYDGEAEEEGEEASSPYSQASMPRIALLGYLEDIRPDSISNNSTIESIRNCFISAHPDAASWVPDAKGKIHDSHWTRLVVEQVYWVGGFGNVAYIGWIPTDMWRSITEKDIEQARLPGERE